MVLFVLGDMVIMVMVVVVVVLIWIYVAGPAAHSFRWPFIGVRMFSRCVCMELSKRVCVYDTPQRHCDMNSTRA